MTSMDIVIVILAAVVGGVLTFLALRTNRMWQATAALALLAVVQVGHTLPELRWAAAAGAGAAIAILVDLALRLLRLDRTS